MTLVNHLKGIDAQSLFHAQAYGRHLVSGHLCKSVVTGSDPTHVITLQQTFGRGPWDGCDGLWWQGTEIKADKYQFYPGTQSTGMGDATQGQDSVFDTDVPHSNIAWVRAELGSGFGEFDTKNNRPEGLSGIFRTSKINNYNSSGSVSSNEFSTNPARQVSDLIIRIGGRPTARIDWPAWCDWRDYLLDDISFNYTALPLDGFGLTHDLYNGTAFDTFVLRRVEPFVEFVSSAGSPGVGVDVDNFSGRLEGKIKALYTETYTFYLTADDGGKLWVNGSLIVDSWAVSGTHSATIALTAGSFYDIKIEWKDSSGNAELRLQWSSSSQSQEVVPPRVLYPKTANRPRYETHPFFAAPTRLDDAVRTILNLCNSTMQEVNGKLRFFCLEQLSSSSFHFTNAKIVDGSLSITPRDVRSLRNSWQAHYRDIDSQYFEEPIDPILIERPDLITAAGRKIDGDAIELFNCTRHQAYRTLDNIVRRSVDSTWKSTFTGTADTFPVLAGDRTELDIEFMDLDDVDTLVLESNDSSSEQTADERTFTAQQWPDFQTYS